MTASSSTGRTGRTGRTASLAARLADRLADAPTGAGVYLLAFYRDGEHIAYGGASPRGRALHYCGFARNIRARLALHCAGEGIEPAPPALVGGLCRSAIL